MTAIVFDAACEKSLRAGGHPTHDRWGRSGRTSDASPDRRAAASARVPGTDLPASQLSVGSAARLTPVAISRSAWLGRPRDPWRRSSLPLWLALGPRRVGDIEHMVPYAARPIAQSGTGRLGHPGDLLHRAGLHPHSITQYAAVGGVMNLVSTRGGVDAHAPAYYHPMVTRDLHDPFVDLPDHLRPERHAPWSWRRR
jgi:hypothetical protein